MSLRLADGEGLSGAVGASRQSVEVLHPGHSRELAKPVCVCWGRIPYNLGSWVHIEEPAMYRGYERIIQPDGPIFFAGDHTSHLVGWQEGAALSARCAVSLISQRQSAFQRSATYVKDLS